MKKFKQGNSDFCHEKKLYINLLLNTENFMQGGCNIEGRRIYFVFSTFNTFNIGCL